MNIIRAELKNVCGLTSVFPPEDLPEIAFAGRSNVGKSSMINTLVNRKALARTSSVPGKTATVNFYEAVFRGEDDTEFRINFVDLPGYGYARTAKSERENWGKLIERYLNNRKSLSAVFLVLDIRRTPNADDILMYQWISAAGFQPVLIVTKSDKIKRSEKQKRLADIRNTFGIDREGKDSNGRQPVIIPFSAEKKDGRDTVLNFISDCFSSRAH